MDLEKHYNEAEAYATSSRYDERVYKAAGFSHRIDRLNESIKNAKSEADVNKYQRLKSDSERILNKYKDTNIYIKN